jgi:hypothetical protein
MIRNEAGLEQSTNCRWGHSVARFALAYAGLNVSTHFRGWDFRFLCRADIIFKYLHPSGFYRGYELAQKQAVRSLAHTELTA